MHRTEVVSKLLYVAAADARGHLMRGHLVRRLLGRHGVEVALVTTSEAGVAFLAALGDPAEVLPGGWRIPYREGQDLDRSAGWSLVRDYAATGLAADRGCLRRLAAGAAAVVCDGHPAPLVAPGGARVIHVTSDSMWAAVRAEAGLLPVDLLRERAWAEIVHGADIDAPTTGWRRRWRLPTLLAAPRRPEPRGVAVYLNPHFRDPALADRIEAAFPDLPLRAVGEGFGGRPGWRAVDPDFVAHAMGAAVLVSAPGMAAVSIARRFGVPMIAISTDQPEQQRNLRLLDGVPHVVVPVHGDFAAARRALGPPGPPRDPDPVVAGIEAGWVRCFASLVPAVHLEEAPCTT